MCNNLWQVNGPEVRESVVPTAQRQQGTTLGLHINGDLLGLFMAQPDWAFQYGISGIAQGFGFVRKRVTMAEVGGRAKSTAFEFKFYLIALGHQVYNFDGFSHYFRADTVAVKQGDFMSAHVASCSSKLPSCGNLEGG